MPLRGTWSRAVPVLALGVLLVVLIGTAWQCDDAFITFRTVKNLWNGHGLTWNPGERVQAYTHPAWMLLSALCFGVTRECFFSVLVLSIVLMLGTALLLVARARDRPLLAAAAVLTLACSVATADYGVSGLENPLLFLLLALSVAALDRALHDGGLLPLALCVAGIGLTRMDALVLVGPAFLYAALAQRNRTRAVKRVALGLSPFVVWELFSLIYYGALVPNTAFAKLNVAVPALELARHGASYFADSITSDPITLLVTLAGCLALLWRGDRARHLLVLGIVLHGLYLLRIGGDFMSGRFFGAPLVLTLAALLTSDELRAALATRVERALLACIVLYGALWPNSRLRVDFGYGVGRTFADVVAPSGIANERAYYYPSTGLMRVLAYEDDIAREELPVPPYREAIRGRAYARSDDRIQVASEVGFFGYFAEDKLVIDGWALSDAFLARIPFESRGSFRVGHYARPIPRGYVESRASGHNRLTDPLQRRLYETVRLVVSGPLFSGARLRALWCFNVGCS